MSLWHSLVDALKLQNCNFFPYSLRRGGASSAYRAGSSLDQLVTKGRWQHVATARVYLDTGLQALVALTLPPAARPKIQKATAYFRTVSQSGTHGRGVPSEELLGTKCNKWLLFGLAWKPICSEGTACRWCEKVLAVAGSN